MDSGYEHNMHDSNTMIPLVFKN